MIRTYTLFIEYGKDSNSFLSISLFLYKFFFLSVLTSSVMVKAYRNIRIKKENRMAGEREAEGKKWNAPKLLPVHKLWRITIFYIIYLRFIACLSFPLPTCVR